MITGQGNGQGAREQGQKCDQLPGRATSRTRSIASTSPSVWGVPEESIPGKGLSAVPLVEAIHDGKIKGLISICFNPDSLASGSRITFALRWRSWSSTSASSSSSPRPRTTPTSCLPAR